MDIDMQTGIVLPDIYVCLILTPGKSKQYRPKHKAHLPVNALYKYNIGLNPGDHLYQCYI